MLKEIIDYVEKFCYDEELLEKLEKADQLQDKIIEYLRSLQNEMYSLTQFTANIETYRRDLKLILELIDNPSGTKEIEKV